MTADAFAAVLAELSEEHGRAVAVHGFDEAHDDRHSDADWSWRLLRRVTEVMAPETVMRTTPEERRRALLECAHIAASAVASHDRRQRIAEVHEAMAEHMPASLDEADAALRRAALGGIVTSADDSWRYVSRPEGDGIERHTLTCTGWGHHGACTGTCTTATHEEPPT